MVTRGSQLVALGLLSLLLLTGCHGQPQARPGLTTLDRAPLHDHGRHAGSLVMASDWQRETGAMASGNYAWYAGRNDLVPSVFAGYATARYERSVTYTRDRQYTSGGRVYDHYHQTTYRRSVRESSRR